MKKRKKEMQPPQISGENSVQCGVCQCWLQLTEGILWRATTNQNDHTSNLPKTDEEIKNYIDNIYKKFNYIEIDDK